MEVKNQMMDQLLATGAAQPSASPQAKPQKDADGPNFESMVHQKRAVGKNDARDEQQTGGEETAQVKTAGKPLGKGQESASDEVCAAAAAALLFQPQPDVRVVPAEEEPDGLTVRLPDGRELNVKQLKAMLEAEPDEPQHSFGEVDPGQAVLETEDDWKTQIRQLLGNDRHVDRMLRRLENGEIGIRLSGLHETAAAEQGAETAEIPAAAPVGAEPDNFHVSPRLERMPRIRDVETSEPEAQLTQTPVLEPIVAHTANAPAPKAAETVHTYAPLPLTAEDGIEQLADRIGDVVVNRTGENRVEITLTPETLGKLTVEISHDETGRLSIVLRPTSERAANLLERSTADLQRALTNTTKSQTEVQVRPNEETQQQQQQFDPNGRGGQQQQQQHRQREQDGEHRSAQEFMQQLRLGLVDKDEED